jgi:hypothetical protein
MNWRKWNRWIHRELGYLFFGMALVYGISGIALNHGVARHWDPGIIARSESYLFRAPLHKEEIDRRVVEELLELTGEEKNFKQYYFPNEGHLLIYLRGGHISVELSTGRTEVIKIRTRPVFRELNYLHYNKPKKAWTWFSDLFALSLILIAISGILMVKGKKGITGSGGILLAAGILIPLFFLALYLWL